MQPRAWRWDRIRKRVPDFRPVMFRLLRKSSRASRRRLVWLVCTIAVMVAVSMILARRSHALSEWITVDLAPVISYQLKIGSQEGWVDVSLLAVPKLHLLPAARNRFRFERIALGTGSMSSVQNRILGRGIRCPWVGIILAEIAFALALCGWWNRPRSRSGNPTRRKRRLSK